MFSMDINELPGSYVRAEFQIYGNDDAIFTSEKNIQEAASVLLSAMHHLNEWLPAPPISGFIKFY